MTLRRLAFISFAAADWICAGILGFLLYVQLDRSYDDSISLAGRHTEELLALHARDDQTRQVIAWLTQYHGEAPGHQAMITFVQWATSNTDSAEGLLGQAGMKPGLAERLAFAVKDGGRTHSFCTAFRHSSSSVIKAILTEVKRFEPSCG